MFRKRDAKKKEGVAEIFFFNKVSFCFSSHGKNLTPFIYLIKCPRVRFLVKVPDEPKLVLYVTSAP